MKNIIIIALLIAASVKAQAQHSISDVLLEVERNNTTLNALREQVQAQQLSNRTGIFLSDPEVEFNYLWGSPVAIGNRQDISVRQSFDFPTSYGYKNQLSRMQNEQVELGYKAERIDLLLETKRVCIELTHRNALLKEYIQRRADAEALAASSSRLFEAGAINVIEYNKARMNLAKIEGEYDLIETERRGLVTELIRLNGGNEIAFSADSFDREELPADFEAWYAETERRSPVLQYVRQQAGIDRTSVKLSRALALPKFSGGYMSENVVGQRFQGVTVGMSVPLWENRNRVKAAKAGEVATAARLEDARVQFYGTLQTLFEKARSHRQTAMSYERSLTEFDNSALLRKAFEKGEISRLDYLVGLSLYYENIDARLDALRNAELAIAQLRAVEL